MIETERLRLRRHRTADFSASHAMWSNPSVTRFIGGAPSTREQSWARIMTYVGHWELLGYGYWVIEEKASGAFVGEIGFVDFKREIVPSLDGLPEAGWVLEPAMHGRGYALEALRAALTWADDNFEAGATVAIITPGNERSFRLAEKAGYRVSEYTAYRDEPIVLVERPRWWPVARVPEREGK